MAARACRYCGAPLLRVRRQDTGRCAAVSADPDPAGRFRLDRRPSGRLIAIKIGRDEDWSGDRYSIHPAVCPRRAMMTIASL